MAKAKGGFQNNATFINWSLTKEQKAEIKAFVMNVDDYDDFLTRLTDTHHKITVSEDKFNDCYSASIVPTAENKINKGYILSGKGSTPLKAVKQACYIHFTVFEGDWSSYSSQTGRAEIDD